MRDADEVVVRDLEPIDRIPGDPAATAWRQSARRHQSAWREAHGWPPGTQTRGRGRGDRLIGSRVDAASGADGANFLSQAARRAAEDRLARPEPLQTLNPHRLRCDLLSSMPMCFNLFGPLTDPGIAAAAVARWWPGFVPADACVSVGFEWSPGRGNRNWLGDRTAFDAVIWIDTPDGRRRLIGIETKYHEYPTAAPKRADPNGDQDGPGAPSRYREVADAAEMFADPATVDTIAVQRVEQVWRDHLLALACRQLEPTKIIEVRYVLVAPAQNPPWVALAGEYADLLAPATRPTFEHRTIDELVHSAADIVDFDSFKARYLDVHVTPAN